MGKENSIKTGTIVKTPRSSNINTSINIGNAASLLPSSTYQFGVVIAVNPVSKEIVYNAIEDNMGSQKQGKALPLYKNKIQLPNIGYIVPLLRGPNPDVSVLSNQYTKTTYYLDPIGVWQNIQDNKIERTTNTSPLTPDVSVDKINIKLTEIGIPNNSPELEQTTINAAERPLPSPSPSPSQSTLITPSPPAPSAKPSSSNFTFRIKLNYDTWEADVYNNNVLIFTKRYVYINFTEQSIRESLKFEAKVMGFYENGQYYPPQPDLI